MPSLNESKNFYLTVGQNIKKYRDLRNYSLQTLGDKVGLTKKTIQRYENGEHKIDMDRLRDISIALNVDIPQLIEGTIVFTVKEERAEYNSEPTNDSESQKDAKLLSELKKFAQENELDLTAPETLELFKDALNFIKRARG